jgi:WD40 repeat protein
LKKIHAHDGKCSLNKLPKNSIVSNGFVDKKIKIWNTETGECLKTFDGYINIDLI